MATACIAGIDSSEGFAAHNTGRLSRTASRMTFGAILSRAAGDGQLLISHPRIVSFSFHEVNNVR